MTAPGPVPGAANPFTGAYQTRQFPNAHNGDPDINIFDALKSPPAAGVAAIAASNPLEEAADQAEHPQAGIV